MPTWYCSASSCGHRLTYLTTKPSECPKCHTPIVNLLKGLTTAAAPTVPPPLTVRAIKATPIDDSPIGRPAVSSRSTPVNRKGPQSKLQQIRANQEDNEGSLIGQDRDEDQDNVDDYEDDGEPYNPREAHRLARQLAASIDPSTIHVNDEDGDGPVTFAKWCRTGS